MNDDKKKKLALHLVDPALAALQQQMENADLMKQLLQESTSQKSELFKNISLLKGDTGDTPVFGVDYFTDSQRQEMVHESTPVFGVDYFTKEQIKSVADLARPVYGKDYLTSKEVEGIKKDLKPVLGIDYTIPSAPIVDEVGIIKKLSKQIPKKVDEQKIIASILSQIPKVEPINFDISQDELLNKINQYDRQVDWKVLKNVPYDVLHGSKGKVGLTRSAVTGSSTSPLTTKGDIFGFSTVGARIPVGTNGQVLTADSTQALGVKWATGGAVSSVSNADGTLTISPTTGAVVASLNLAKANTWTADQTISSAALIFSGNISSPAWTTNGVRIKGTAATFTDTTSTGTVALGYTSVFGGNTIAATSVTTFTEYDAVHIAEPLAGANVTLTNKFALRVDSLKIGTSPFFTVSNAGTVTAGTWNGSAVGIAYGGTNTTSFPNTNGVVYYDGLKLTNIAAGSAGTVLLGTGGVPSFSTLTFSQISGQLNLASQVSGTLGTNNGGTGATSLTQGSVVFAGASGVYTQDNTNFFWDNTNKRLGIGNAAPAEKLDINGNIALNGNNIIQAFAKNTLPDNKATNSGTTLTGTMYFADAAAITSGTVTGIGTLFSSELKVGDKVNNLTGASAGEFGGQGGNFYVKQIVSNTSLILTRGGGSQSTGAGSAFSAKRYRSIYSVADTSGVLNLTITDGMFYGAGANNYLSGSMAPNTFLWNGNASFSTGADVGTVTFYRWASTGGWYPAYTSNSSPAFFCAYDIPNGNVKGVFSAGNDNLYVQADGQTGMGNTAPSAKLHIIKTTEQLRLGYDVSNYYSTTVNSTGGVTFDAIGSGAKFQFYDQLIGKGTATNDNAAASYIGEYVSASVVQGSAVALTTATPKTVTSITLTAGDWDVTGIGALTGASTGTVFDVAVGTTTNSLTGTVLGDTRAQTPTVSLTGADATLMIPAVRVSISATTTYYLIVQETFTIGSPSAYGRISARRIR